MSKIHFFLSSAIVFSSLLHAQPQGFSLIEGEAYPPIVDEWGCTVVKVGKQATIHWDSFSIEENESFRFEQEDSESSVINFVTGESKSAILGNLQSNGKVYLTHPSELFIGSEGSLSAPHLFLVSELGKLDVHGTLKAEDPSGKGGKIHVLGKEVDVKGTARIDASGAAGEGEVLIGGSFQGEDRSIPHSQSTIIHAGAHISVDSVHNGNGGRAIIWSDNTTQFSGHVNAAGGEEGGDGGFVEISGKEQMAFNGTVMTMAPKGKTGQLLMDPKDVFIVPNQRTFIPGQNPILFGNSPGTDFGFEFFSIVDALGTTNILIEAVNNIYMAADFVFGPPAAPNSLELRAGKSILMQGDFVLNLGGGNFTAFVNFRVPKQYLQFRTGGGACFFKAVGHPRVTTTSGDITVGSIRGISSVPAEGGVIQIAPDTFTTQSGNIIISPVQPIKQAGGGPLLPSRSSFPKVF